MSHQEEWSSNSTRQFYNWIGPRYDWFSLFEAKAKLRALELLEFQDEEKMLIIGIGTGREIARMLRLHKQKGLIVGVDLSEKMLEMSSQHNQFCLIQADACNLPVSTHSFNRIFCSYVLEILPPSLLPGFLSRAYQVLSPNGRMVLLSLAEGMSSTSRLVMSLWKKIYKINPMLCGGCIPLDLGGMAQKAGLPVLHREILIQMAIPSEIVVIE